MTIQKFLIAIYLTDL